MFRSVPTQTSLTLSLPRYKQPKATMGVGLVFEQSAAATALQVERERSQKEELRSEKEELRPGQFFLRIGWRLL